MQMTNEFGRYHLVPLSFHQDAVAASQTAVAMNTVEAEGVVQTNTGYEIPWAYQIVGISALSGAARTAGTLTVDATIGGTVTGVQAILDGTNTTDHSSTQRRDTDNGAAQTVLGCKVTTDGSWAPVTADINVVVWILVDILGV
jgi:hypothetical protein